MIRILVYIILAAVCLSSCFFSDDDPLLPPEITDPCSIVHETYPNVGEDSCSWVLNVMRNFQPPTVLPSATDTGGQLLAARVITDTSEFLFVAGGVPDRFLGTPCTWWNSQRNGELPLSTVSGIYCRRPPVDPNEYSLTFDISDSLKIYQEEFRFRVRFEYGSIVTGQTVFELVDTDDFRFHQLHENDSSRILSGLFEATLHNRDDPTDSIRLVDGRFDMRY